MKRGLLTVGARARHETHPDGYDVLLISGEAAVDHPAFPSALLARLIESLGYRVVICPRPDPEDVEALVTYGAPRLFVGLTAGALDSMVANYTAQKRLRADDPYAPGGVAGGRPDRALTAYANLARRAFGKQTLIVAGGVEASLRAFAHYDYWSGRIRRPLLVDMGADLLVRGMGERPLRELLAVLEAAHRGGGDLRPQAFLPRLTEIPGLVWRQAASQPAPEDALALPEADGLREDPRAYAAMQHLLETHRHARFTQVAGGQRIIANPPAEPLNGVELDALYDLPFTRDVHPFHGGAPVPALEQVRFSITSHRGCAGGCAFCAIASHQGRRITSRSEAGIRRETAAILAHPAFRGTINDLGGPSADMYGYTCTGPKACTRVSCLWPTRCPHFAGDPGRYVALLGEIRATPGLTHLFVTTGLRLELAAHSPALVDALARHHTSGRLKVAPEHLVPEVLTAMRKPAAHAFLAFRERFLSASAQAGKRQQVVPYLMAAHPGCTLSHMAELAVLMKKHGVVAEQCQIFTPTPGTCATAMYATGLDPATLKPIFVERDAERREWQKALILYHERASAPAIRAALRSLKRPELADFLLGETRAKRS